MTNKIILIDRFMLAAFLLCALSGIALHLAGHGGNHHLWHNWAVGHIAASLAFLIAAFFHVKTHWGWYKGIFKKGFGKRSKPTAILSILFIFVAATGITLLFISGPNSGIGHYHYVSGIILIALSLGHIIKRHTPLFRRKKPAA